MTALTVKPDPIAEQVIRARATKSRALKEYVKLGRKAQKNPRLMKAFVAAGMKLATGDYGQVLLLSHGYSVSKSDDGVYISDVESKSLEDLVIEACVRREAYWCRGEADNASTAELVADRVILDMYERDKSILKSYLSKYGREGLVAVACAVLMGF